MAVVKVPITHKITGHKAVREALRNTAEYSSDLQGDADVRDYRQLPLEVDPPRHHLYRTALTQFFVRPAIEKHMDDFRRITDIQLQEFFAQPQGELISELALPLVMKNLGQIYNRPQDVDEWISWGPDVWTVGGGPRSGDHLHRYLDRVYEEALLKKSHDIWRQIAELEIEGKQIGADEFRGIAGVLLAGGRDTVVKLFTGIMWYLSKNPDVLKEIRADRALIDSAIPELLRFLTPLPAMARTTTPETGADELPEDRYIEISFISGNFDETVFEDPYQIDIHRSRNPHLSFGFGPHTCLGNHVAEMEAKVFLEALLDLDFNWKVLPDSEITFYSGKMASVPDHFKNVYVAREIG